MQAIRPSLAISLASWATSFYATAFHDFSNHNDIGISVGFVIPFGARSSGNVSAQSDSGTQSGQLQVSQTASQVGEWGYRGLLSAQRQDSGASDVSDHEFAEVSYKSPWGMAFAGVDHLSDQTTLQGEARGAISFADGAVFASNRVDDSFAIVDTGGFEGIAVQQENRYAGRTDSAGKLLVPDLRSFEINHLSIDPLDAPIDADVPFSKREVRPQDRSGVVVQFPLKVNHGALLRLTDADGKPIPVDSTATLLATGVTVPVGYDGEAYLVDVQAHNQLRVELPNGRHCAVDFDYRPTAGEIPIIGPLSCREAQAMIRKIALAAFLFLLSGPPPTPSSSARFPPPMSPSGSERSVSTNADLTAIGAIVISCIGTGSHRLRAQR